MLGAFGVAAWAKAGGTSLTTFGKTQKLVADGRQFAGGSTAVRNTLLAEYGMPLRGMHRVGGPVRTGIVRFAARSTANTYAVVNTGRAAVTQGAKADGQITDRPDVSLFDAQAHPSRSTRPILGPVDPWKAGKTAGKILTTAWR